MLLKSPEARASLEAELASREAYLRQREIATGREYFFGIYGLKQLSDLVAALPGEADFRV